MFDHFFRHPFMSRAGIDALDAESVVAALCQVETALARAEEAEGLLPAGTAAALKQALRPEAFDLAALADDVGKGGNVAIPFVKQGRSMLPEALKPAFHRGATSQDIVDTALMLLLKPRLQSCLSHLARLRRAQGELMRRYRDTPMIGRTLMQQALPITFGVKVAQWTWGVCQAEQRLQAVVDTRLYVQFGGAVGVHSGLDPSGIAIMEALARTLGLESPLLPWHTDRQPILELMGAVDAVAVALEKAALDIALLCQSEIGELSEPAAPGVGGSSSMPHKRNPVACARIRAAARQIHGQHGVIVNAGAQPLERGLGEWHAEWAPLLDAVLSLEGALESMVPLLEGLEVHEASMKRNLRLSGGAIMAEPATRLLCDIMSSDDALELAQRAGEEARRECRDYAEVLLEFSAVAEDLDPDEVRSALSIELYIGSSLHQVDRCLSYLQSF
ncbi:MAG: adenylosuccinate lyase family protein [Salinicola sp.]|uniref:class-II fumarase/aspartase family protein n=1 Tax=Salinicola sp. TaxID=1978524 RepID=UPI001DCBA822|nr:adenylosuccinate lyase family protein [Salinicola sp.]NRB56956.1 adenylosuccinate lyase family protein [Salinicola sp.]